jgi:hypothetical protein
MDHHITRNTVIDLRAGRSLPENCSAQQRIIELAGPGSDPGWIAGLLNREGYPSPNGRPWSPEDVLAVLSHRHGAPA